jgi:hypothetical protein
VWVKESGLLGQAEQTDGCKARGDEPPTPQAKSLPRELAPRDEWVKEDQ